MRIENVSIVGCGALGIMYGSHMLKSISPDRVRFIADGKRVERYKKTAFYANDVKQGFHFASPGDGGGDADLMIFAVKSNHLRKAMETAKGYVGERTVILSFLNGITSEKTLAEAFGPEKVLYSIVAGMDATKEGNSLHYSNVGYVAFGSLGEVVPGGLDNVAAFFDEIQLKYERPRDIMKKIWWKYILNIGVNQTSALLRFPYGPFQHPGYAENVLRMAMAEAYAVSKKLGIGLGDEDIEACVKIIRTLDPAGKTSMCQDMEAGRPTEVDIFSGALIELGERHGVPVPVNRFLFNAIKALEEQYPGGTEESGSAAL